MGLFTQRLFPTASTFVAKPLREKLADTAGQKVVVAQVGLDQFIHHPFILFPAFYQLKEFIEGGTPEAGFRKYMNNIAQDCKVCWACWVPASSSISPSVRIGCEYLSWQLFRLASQ